VLVIEIDPEDTPSAAVLRVIVLATRKRELIVIEFPLGVIGITPVVRVIIVAAAVGTRALLLFLPSQLSSPFRRRCFAFDHSLCHGAKRGVVT
jgi:hypothetical protein